jgi:hypothetical protein
VSKATVAKTNQTKPNGVNIMSSFMNNIHQIVKLAQENHGFISINGYVSKGSGQVANFQVQPLGADGYHRLVRESIEQAPSLERPIHFDEETWKQALKEQIASWQKTLDGGHDRKDNFSKEKKGFYGHADNDSVYIRNFVVVNKKVIKKGEFKAVNSRPKTLAKKHILKQVPLGKYQGQMKLDEGGFDNVKYNGIIIEG